MRLWPNSWRIPPRAGSHLLSGALVGVLLFLAGVAVWAERNSHDAISVAKIEASRVDLYRQLEYGISQEPVLQSGYLNPRNRAHVELVFRKTSQRIGNILSLIEAQHISAGAELAPVRRLEANHAVYSANMLRFFMALDHGNTRTAANMQAGVLIPAWQNLTGDVNQASYNHFNLENSALQRLTTSEGGDYVGTLVVIVAALLFAIALIISLMRVQRRREIERRAVVQSEKLLRASFYQAGTGNVLTTLDTRLLQVNQAFCMMLGYSEHDLLQLSMKDITHPEDFDTSLQMVERVINNQLGAAHFIKRYIHSDGHAIWAQAHLVLLRDDNTNPQYIMNQVFDISEQKQSEDELRDSENRYRDMFEKNGAVKLLIDVHTGLIADANPSACAFYKFSLSELRQKHIRELSAVSSADTEVEINGLLKGELPTVVCQHRLSTGDTRDVEMHCNIMEVRESPVLYAVVRDITDRRRSEDRLRKSEERYRSLVNTSPDAILLTDLDANIVVANPAAALLYGYDSPDELRGMGALAMTVPEDHESLSAAIAATAQMGHGFTDIEEYQRVRKDGTTFPAESRTAVITDSDGNASGFLVTIRDISMRKQAQEANMRLASVVEAVSDSIVSMTLDGIITSWNPGAEKLYGYSAEEIIGKSAWVMVPPDLTHERDSLFEQLAQGRRVKHFETARVRKDGRRIDVSVSISPIRDGKGATNGYAVTAYDITEHKAFEEQLKHQALHDALTRLPNRVLLFDRLDQAILSAQRIGAPITLLLMDLDRFKEVNDALGHHAGDLLLQEVALRLSASLRQTDTVARLGGDEFAIILPDVDESRAILIAQKLQSALRHPLVLESHRIDIDASIGLALFPTHGKDAPSLLRRADVAMYAAKRSGAGHRIYSPDQDLSSPQRLSLVSDLRTAIDGEQLVLHYQPKVNIRSGATEQVEALVRWQHPEHGLIPPGEFITIAEETGLIEPLTLWVLTTALAHCASWRRSGMQLSVAVNLSARNLHDPRIPDTIAWLVRKAGLDPSSLIVEITESSLMLDPDGALLVLTRLHEMGVKISIDDFGTGYSSLAYLKQLPVDEIKIDRSFVLGMARSGTVIVRSVVDLGRNLDIAVTAEGVEDEETLDMLARMGCERAQGYYLSRPLPAPALAVWVQARGTHGTSTPAGQEVILVVDDNPVYQELIQVLLSDEGYQVTTVGNAEEALVALESLTPDLVLTDVQLPGMSGLELVRQIREHHHLRQAVIVAITGAPRAEDETYALSIGCDVYTAKPTKNRDVLQLVRQHLHSAVRRDAGV